MELATRRLELRPLGQADLARIHVHWGAPEVYPWLWDEEAPTGERVAEELAQSLETFAEHGFGLWGVYRDDGLFVGTCGLAAVPGQAGEFEMVFSIEPSERRRGYAFEAAEAVLRYAFDAGLDRVLGRCDRRNEPSRRLFEKLGAVFDLASIAGVDDHYFLLKR